MCRLPVSIISEKSIDRRASYCWLSRSKLGFQHPFAQNLGEKYEHLREDIFDQFFK